MKVFKKHIYITIKFLMCGLIFFALIINPTIKTVNTISKSYLELVELDIEQHNDKQEKQEERESKNEEFKILNAFSITLYQSKHTNSLGIYKEKKTTYLHTDIIISPPDFKS